MAVNWIASQSRVHEKRIAALEKLVLQLVEVPQDSNVPCVVPMSVAKDAKSWSDQVAQWRSNVIVPDADCDVVNLVAKDIEKVVKVPQMLCLDSLISSCSLQRNAVKTLPLNTIVDDALADSLLTDDYYSREVSRSTKWFSGSAVIDYKTLPNTPSRFSTQVIDMATCDFAHVRVGEVLPGKVVVDEHTTSCDSADIGDCEVLHREGVVDECASCDFAMARDGECLQGEGVVDEHTATCDSADVGDCEVLHGKGVVDEGSHYYDGLAGRLTMEAYERLSNIFELIDEVFSRDDCVYVSVDNIRLHLPTCEVCTLGYDFCKKERIEQYSSMNRDVPIVLFKPCDYCMGLKKCSIYMDALVDDSNESDFARYSAFFVDRYQPGFKVDVVLAKKILPLSIKGATMEMSDEVEIARCKQSFNCTFKMIVMNLY